MWVSSCVLEAFFRVVSFGCYSMVYIDRIRLAKNGDRLVMSEQKINFVPEVLKTSNP